MRHPSQETLALHAGGDLGWPERWSTKRHLSGCDDCRDEVVAFSEVRDVLPELNQMPEVPWNRIALEMRANIRLGLAAGECVRLTNDITPPPAKGDEHKAPNEHATLYEGRAALHENNAALQSGPQRYLRFGAPERVPFFPMHHSSVKGARAVVAFASVCALLAVGLMLERPAPVSASEPMVQATDNGIQRRSGNRAFGLMHAGARNVTYSVGAQGTLGARYVDPETGAMTMTKVYVE